MKQKNIVVIYYGDDWHKDIPISSGPTRDSFEDWYVRAQDHNITLYRASLKWYDEKKGVFKKAWTFKDGVWKKIRTSVRADLIYDKVMGKRDYQLYDQKMKINGDTPIFNHPLFRTIADNKLSQYMVLGEFMPASALATNKKNLALMLKKIPGSRVVVKPFHGSGGFGIFIGAKKDALRKRFAYPVLLQEFVKSTKGIPGFSQKDEVADLRLIYTNHKQIYALSRIAKKGSLFTNFHQGAHAVLVPENKIPASVERIAKQVVKKLSVFPYAHYSLDFIFTNDKKPVLIEMNTTPGFDLLHIVGNEKIKKKNFEMFIKTLDHF